MDIESILTHLKEELTRIENAITALTGFGSQSTPRRGPGRPAGTGKKRTMSASARKRISEAMKARWAKQKGKAAPKKAAPKRKPMSPAARKKLSAMMKARWAEAKKAGRNL
jgi:hypothetical protein